MAESNCYEDDMLGLNRQWLSVMGCKGTPFSHLQFMTQSVPPPQIVIMLGNRKTTIVRDPPPLILHFNHCKQANSLYADICHLKSYHI